MRILMVGGSKSGKSHLAQRVVKALAAGGPMIYWATMEPSDDEDLQRIQKHLEDRSGWGFSTLECARALDSCPNIDPDASVLFDSATALVTNEMFPREGGIVGDAGIIAAEELISVSCKVKNFVLVADDVFRDGALYDETTEKWRQALADTLRAAAERFDSVIEVSAGIMKAVKGSLPPLAPDLNSEETE